jgi:two-component system alkaline phosphatase synthesis response regulator PhoP
MGKRIMVVEDEPGLTLSLSDRLEGDGYAVETAADGETVLVRAASDPFDLIVLDVMLPRMSGLEVCRGLRERGVNTPVLMLTACGQVRERVAGLKSGADDYLPKPFEMAELLARVEALLRRARHDAAAHEEGVYRRGTLRVDFKRAEVECEGRPVALSPREFKLLCFLVRNGGRVLSRDQLLDAVWGKDAMPTNRTVDVHISWLRQKVEPNPAEPRLILTVHGHGYKFAG